MFLFLHAKQFGWPQISPYTVCIPIPEASFEGFSIAFDVLFSLLEHLALASMLPVVTTWAF